MSNFGYVYVFYDYLVTHCYKIGLTRNPKARLHKIHKGLPFEFLEIYAIIPSPNPEALEKILHAKFREKHKRNEYFDLTEDDLKFIDGLKLGANQDTELAA